MAFVQDYGIQQPTSVLQPEIALRDPLDQEFVLNRKMAKKYYQQQLQQRMSENRQKNFESEEKKKKDLHDKEAKKEKVIANQRKEDNMRLNQKIRTRIEMETERREERARKARETATKILRDAREEERQRVERENKKQADYNAKLEEAFERDKKNREIVAARGDEAAQKERMFEKEIVNRLDKADYQFTQKIVSKEEQLRIVQEKAARRSEIIQERMQLKKEEEKKAEDERMLNYLNKVHKVDKKRTQVKKSRAMSQHTDKIPTKERLAEIKKMKDQELKDQARKIQKGIQQRERQIERNMNYMREENERRKEVKSLHKIDQEDNLQRKQAFERMGLENKVQMILEK